MKQASGGILLKGPLSSQEDVPILQTAGMQVVLVSGMYEDEMGGDETAMEATAEPGRRANLFAIEPSYAWRTKDFEANQPPPALWSQRVRVFFRY